MRYLSPSQYSHWPAYAQRICYAYNSVPHDSIAHLSPFEMDFASPPTSPFGPPDPALLLQTNDQLHAPSSVSPAEFAAALRISVQTFHALAASHKKTFLATTTAERLNQHGTPTIFALHDKVKIYVPPTHAQILHTGRKSNHIVAWRGPCTITRILSPSPYEMKWLKIVQDGPSSAPSSTPALSALPRIHRRPTTISSPLPPYCLTRSLPFVTPRNPLSIWPKFSPSPNLTSHPGNCRLSSGLARSRWSHRAQRLPPRPQPHRRHWQN